MSKDKFMIKMQVMGVALDTRTGSPIVVLSDNENRKALPIWIGSAEASAIIRHIEGIETLRPMTHDLIVNLINSMNYSLKKIEIYDYSEETFYANIYLQNEEGKELIIDARPSDAIAIALRTESAIMVSPKVISSGTVSTDKQKDKEEAEEFKKFVEELKPSDFKKLLDKDKDLGENS